MLEKYALFKVLNVFVEEPYKQFYLREVAKEAGVGSGTAKACLDWLAERSFLERERKGNLFLFKSDFKAQVFRHFKVALNVLKIEESGLVKGIERLPGISSAVLFGSFARGENDKKSDLDILIVGTTRHRLDLGPFSERIGSEINVISFTSSEWKRKAKEDKPFYERVVMDGIALVGEIPVLE